MYFNVDHVLETVLQRVLGDPELRRVVYDLSHTPYVDVAGWITMNLQPPLPKRLVRISPASWLRLRRLITAWVCHWLA